MTWQPPKRLLGSQADLLQSSTRSGGGEERGQGTAHDVAAICAKSYRTQGELAAILNVSSKTGEPLGAWYAPDGGDCGRALHGCPHAIFSPPGGDAGRGRCLTTPLHFLVEAVSVRA